MEIIFIIAVLTLVYFFGSAIKSVLGGLGDMTAKEFDLVKDQQDFRIAKQYDNLGNKITESKFTHGKGSVRAQLRALNDIENA